MLTNTTWKSTLDAGGEGELENVCLSCPTPGFLSNRCFHLLLLMECSYTCPSWLLLRGWNSAWRGEASALFVSLGDSLFPGAAHHGWRDICHHSSCVPVARCPPKEVPRKMISVKWFLNTGACIMETSSPRKIRTLSLAADFSVHLYSFLWAPCCVWATQYVRWRGWNKI